MSPSRRRAYQWLAPGEVLDGLAETTPGPSSWCCSLWASSGRSRRGRLVAAARRYIGRCVGHLGHIYAVFLVIFLGAPFVEQLRGNQALSSALTAITGAIVGVMLNLAIWFGIHTVFTQVVLVEVASRVRLATVCEHPLAGVITDTRRGTAVFVFKRGLLTTLFGACLAGLAMQQVWVA